VVRFHERIPVSRVMVKPVPVKMTAVLGGQNPSEPRGDMAGLGAGETPEGHSLGTETGIGFDGRDNRFSHAAPSLPTVAIRRRMNSRGLAIVFPAEKPPIAPEQRFA
jgi:hypothetical protein